VGDKAKDPIDHDRTTRKHAGRTMKDTAATPGLVAIGLGTVALVVALFGFARGQVAAGVIAAGAAVLLMGAGCAWLIRESRRVRRIENRYLQEHPEVHAEPPTS
jgi:uncharacterized membrane protein YcjF (UPF0283 family)